MHARRARGSRPRGARLRWWTSRSPRCRLAPEERPLLLSVSGVDDLAPDTRGRVDDGSPLRTTPTGFSHVGVPVRRLVEASGVAAAFLHLGTVYGPGKSFAASIFPRLARG